MTNKRLNQRQNVMEEGRNRQINLLKVFIVCALTVGLLFVVCEIVERLWLKGVDPDIIHAIHIVRGFLAAVVASVLATLIFSRQTHNVDPQTILSSSEKSWKRRLQKARLRTKIVVPMVVLAILPAMTIGIFTISQMQKSLRERAIQRVKFDNASKAQAIQGFLQTVQQDLHFLRQVKEVRELIDAEAAGDSKRVALLRRKVEEALLLFSQGKRAYYQVRCLNGDGYEMVRLNVEEGMPKIVPSHELQDKSGRYYVKAAFALKAGEVYVSPMDLNIEHGKVESPQRGVVRYATPVTGEKGSSRGLLIININADYLLSLVGPLAPGTEAWLVDRNGAYLGYVGESEARRKLFHLEKRRQLSEDYASGEIKAILGHSLGVLTLKRGGAFLSNAPISIDQGDPERHWTLLVGYPQGPIEDPIRRLTTLLSVVMTFVIAFAGILGVLIGDYLSRPIVRLQSATRAIAGGDLKKHVDIATGDEIEGLANDFNAMTERLREAQNRLAGWNLELKREVEHQTGILQQLQSGMARTDKLASIGQITAGVMHEVGNPLAAIKTQIQVAEEEGVLCTGCQKVLTEIIGEVDRLAVFLRSFSRLSRLSGQQIKEDVSLPEVARNVIALVKADLRRKGLSLRYGAVKDIPKIRGVADQLRQLLMNLILNAADASGEGNEIVVWIRREAPETSINGLAERVRLEVEDHGEGISQEIRDKIWDPFFTTKHDGTGLGLAICRRIVHDHGGTIQIDSEIGKGTVVVVTFPVERVNELKAPQVTSETVSDPLQEDVQP